MSNEWNERLLESLYEEAYSELVADGMDEEEAKEHAADLAITRYQEM